MQPDIKINLQKRSSNLQKKRARVCVYKIKQKWSSGRPWQINSDIKGRRLVRPPGE